LASFSQSVRKIAEKENPLSSEFVARFPTSHSCRHQLSNRLRDIGSVLFLQSLKVLGLPLPMSPYKFVRILITLFEGLLIVGSGAGAQGKNSAAEYQQVESDF